jgi:hypothetical protein
LSCVLPNFKPLNSNSSKKNQIQENWVWVNIHTYYTLAIIKDCMDTILKQAFKMKGHKQEGKIGSQKWDVATPLWVKCEDETHTPKVGDLESSGTPECLEFDSRGQNTSHWGVLGVIEKVLKCRCPKWRRIDHLDICSPSYGQKKGRE